MAVGGGDLYDFVPAAGNAVQQNKKCGGAPCQVDEKLRDVGPDDGFHAAFQGVQQREGDDDHHGEMFGGAENHAEDQRDSGDAHSFGDGARNEKSGGGHRAHAGAKALFDQRVGGKKISTKIAGQQQQDDEHAPDEVTEDKLKKSEISAVGDGGSADDGERGGFRGHDGKSQRPPWRGAPAEKIFTSDGVAIFSLRRGQRTMPAAEVHAQRGYRQQIDDDDGQIERCNVHQEW